MERTPRLLPLIGAFNFRDLGGYRTVDGRVTRWGRLFRSDTLHELTDTDVELLREIGLATVIDLRTVAELERTGRGALRAEPVHYLHLPLIERDVTSEEVPDRPVHESLARQYLWYLEVGRQTAVDALVTVADPKSHPLVFHCAAGKDRTGVLAALLLDTLGVERDVIVEDYVLTQSRMDLIAARLRRERDEAKRVAEIPQFLLRAEAATMEQFLSLLHQEHGGGREWALANGLTVSVLDEMCSLLLEEYDENC